MPRFRKWHFQKGVEAWVSGIDKPVHEKGGAKFVRFLDLRGIEERTEECKKNTLRKDQYRSLKKRPVQTQESVIKNKRKKGEARKSHSVRRKSSKNKPFEGDGFLR